MSEGTFMQRVLCSLHPQKNNAFTVKFPTLEERQKALTKRLTSQVIYEESTFYLELADKEWSTYYYTRLRRAKILYKSIPQPGARMIILTKVPHPGSKPLPSDRFELEEFLLELVHNIPKGKRISGSRDFGGPLSGSRPKSGEYLDTGCETLEEFAALLDRYNITYKWKDSELITFDDAEGVQEIIAKRKAPVDLNDM